MLVLLAKTATLKLFSPVLFATSVALIVLVVGRLVATRNYTRALQANAKWAPSIPTASSFPLNRVDTRPPRRPSSPGDLLSASDPELSLRFAALQAMSLSPADSAATTLRVERIYIDIDATEIASDESQPQS